MKTNQNKVKLLIVLAILFIVFLLVCSIAMLISIQSTKKTIAQQNAEIEKLENQIKYYEQLSDSQQPDYSITPEE